MVGAKAVMQPGTKPKGLLLAKEVVMLYLSVLCLGGHCVKLEMWYSTLADRMLT
jgi:hypothetical protein